MNNKILLFILFSGIMLLIILGIYGILHNKILGFGLIALAVWFAYRLYKIIRVAK